MGLLGLLLGGWLIWLMLTGRLAKPNGAQIGGLVFALVGGIMAAKGNIAIGVGMAVIGLAWLSRKSEVKKPRSSSAQDDPRVRDALDLLGLPLDADRAAVVNAHRRLIARTHPDTGGTEALARNINAARDYLLERLP